MKLFKDWKGNIEVNGTNIDTVDFETLTGAVSIHLIPLGYTPTEPKKSNVEIITDSKTYVVKVKAWMTKSGFEFMQVWNKDVPMPLRIMTGTINKQTEKMLNMTLHGDILQEITQTCMCCGKPITNEVSKYFGMGPVCGKHNYTNPFGSQEELKAAVGEYRKKLQSITWEGWIPKSAIETLEIRN